MVYQPLPSDHRESKFILLKPSVQYSFHYIVISIYAPNLNKEKRCIFILYCLTATSQKICCKRFFSFAHLPVPSREIKKEKSRPKSCFYVFTSYTPPYLHSRAQTSRTRQRRTATLVLWDREGRKSDIDLARMTSFATQLQQPLCSGVSVCVIQTLNG